MPVLRTLDAFISLLSFVMSATSIALSIAIMNSDIDGFKTLETWHFAVVTFEIWILQQNKHITEQAKRT